MIPRQLALYVLLVINRACGHASKPNLLADTRSAAAPRECPWIASIAGFSCSRSVPVRPRGVPVLLHIVTVSLASQMLTVNMKRTCSYWKAQWYSFHVMLLRLHGKPLMQLIRDKLCRLVYQILQGSHQYAFTAKSRSEKGQFSSLSRSERRRHDTHDVISLLRCTWTVKACLGRTLWRFGTLTCLPASQQMLADHQAAESAAWTLMQAPPLQEPKGLQLPAAPVPHKFKTGSLLSVLWTMWGVRIHAL